VQEIKPAGEKSAGACMLCKTDDNSQLSRSITNRGQGRLLISVAMKDASLSSLPSDVMDFHVGEY